MNYQTLQVRFQGPICFLSFHRPQANNTINNVMLEECAHVISLCEDSITIVMLEGLPVFVHYTARSCTITSGTRYSSSLSSQIVTGP